MSSDVAFKLASAGVALAALVLSIVNFVRTSRISDRQYSLSFSQDVYNWSADIMQLFKDAHVAIDLNDNYADLYDKLSDVCHRLSVLWDQGRFLFPNFESDNVGLGKEPAYRGYRHAVLDQLAIFHDQLSAHIDRVRQGHPDNIVVLDGNGFVSTRRQFVSEVQKVMKTKLRFDLAQAAR